MKTGFHPAGREQSDFYVVDAAEPEVVVAKILAVLCDRIPWGGGFDPIRDIQVLCPMTEAG